MKTDEYINSAGQTQWPVRSENYQNISSTATIARPTRSVSQPTAPPKTPADAPRPLVQDLICFSHLRWNFVYQRPQHLMNRASQEHRVWFIEEPIWGDEFRVEIRPERDQLNVVVPHVPHGTPFGDVLAFQRAMLADLRQQHQINTFIAWYYTPMALLFSNHLTPALTVYDCMDELSAFMGAPPELLDLEKQLLRQAAMVFTGGYSLYEAKQHRHPRVFAFPSSIERNHFGKARARTTPEPADQQAIGHPRIGFSGVVDERFDRDLLAKLAQRRPDWQFVILGPVVKIDPASLPNSPNVHYLGMKAYADLPAYFAHWDAAILPFALNDSTRYISPTKTPEYLAAGLPVVSTPIRDVVSMYGCPDFAQIADTAEAFEQALEQALAGQHPPNWVAIDGFLAENSWDITWQTMNRHIQSQLAVSLD